MKPTPRTSNLKLGFAGLYLLIVSAILASVACLFDTREPQPPGDIEPQCPWVEPTSLDFLLQDLVQAVECDDDGITNYERLFTDDFVFDVDDSDSLDLISLGEREAYWNWTYDVEVSVFTEIASSADSIRLEADEIGRQDTEEDPWLEVHYTLTTYLNGVPSEFTGVALFTLFREGGTLKIASWKDTREGTSWGRLKGEKRRLAG